MITGFEEHTEPLNELEIKLAHLIALIIQGRIGVHNALKNHELSDLLNYQHGIRVAPGKMRKIINYIRRKKLVINLIANSKGYYVAKNRKEIEEYVMSLLQRMDAIKEVAESFEYNPDQAQLWNL